MYPLTIQSDCYVLIESDWNLKLIKSMLEAASRINRIRLEFKEHDS